MRVARPTLLLLLTALWTWPLGAAAQPEEEEPPRPTHDALELLALDRIQRPIAGAFFVIGEKLAGPTNAEGVTWLDGPFDATATVFVQLITPWGYRPPRKRPNGEPFDLRGSSRFTVELAGTGKRPASPGKRVRLTVTATEPDGKPVPDAIFLVNGAPVARTGLTPVRITVPAVDGDTLRFDLVVPKDYALPPETDKSKWKLPVKHPPRGQLEVNFESWLISTKPPSNDEDE